MGVVYSTLLRKTRRINVENRAMRAIERNKPVSAPLHPSSKKYFEEIIEESPEVREELLKKHPKLDKHLKDVYVTSTDIAPEVVRDRSLLPQNRKPVVEDEFGFWQPPEIPKGQATLAQILKFLADHQGDSKLWTASAIAKQHQLDEKTVGNVLEYFRTFNLYLPTLPKDKSGILSMKRLIGNAQAAIEDIKKENAPKEETPKEEPKGKT